MTQGVYQILNVVTNSIYIGSSSVIEQRWRTKGEETVPRNTAKNERCSQGALCALDRSPSLI